MTERLHGLDDDALGRALATTARDIEWPATPDVADRVSRALHDHERHPSLARPRLSLPHRRRTLLLVVAAGVLLAAAAVAAKVVIDLGALTIDTIPGRPSALPSAVTSGPTLGHPATLAEAEREAGFAAQVPTTLGVPDAVWVDTAQDGACTLLAVEHPGPQPPRGAARREHGRDIVIRRKHLNLSLRAPGDVRERKRLDLIRMHSE